MTRSGCYPSVEAEARGWAAAMDGAVAIPGMTIRFVREPVQGRAATLAAS